jgi:hypothetical protein
MFLHQVSSVIVYAARHLRALVRAPAFDSRSSERQYRNPNAYAEGYFRRLLAPGSMPATWALDWRRNGDGGRHYNQVSYRAWLAATLVNMWVGVSKAGYSIKDEAPVALLVFAVPAITSILIWWRTSCAGAQCLGH